MCGQQFQFEWDEIKAAAKVRKHGVSFDLARTAVVYVWLERESL